MSHTGENTDHSSPEYFRIAKIMCPKSHPMRTCQKIFDYTKSIKQEESRQQKQKWSLLLKSKVTTLLKQISDNRKITVQGK